MSQTQEINTGTQEYNTGTQEISTMTQEYNTGTQEINTETQEYIGTTQQLNQTRVDDTAPHGTFPERPIGSTGRPEQTARSEQSETTGTDMIVESTDPTFQETTEDVLEETIEESSIVETIVLETQDPMTDDIPQSEIDKQNEESPKTGDRTTSFVLIAISSLSFVLLIGIMLRVKLNKSDI